MHCCVLHISCIQGTVLDSVSCRPLSYFAIAAMNVVGVDTYTPRTVVPALTCGLYAFVFVCAFDSGTQGLRGASLEINRIYNHFQKIFMITPLFWGRRIQKQWVLGREDIWHESFQAKVVCRWLVPHLVKSGKTPPPRGPFFGKNG